MASLIRAGFTTFTGLVASFVVMATAAAGTNRLLYENSDGILLEDSSGDLELQ